MSKHAFNSTDNTSRPKEDPLAITMDNSKCFYVFICTGTVWSLDTTRCQQP